MIRWMTLALVLTGCAGSNAERLCNMAAKCAAKGDDPEEYTDEEIDQCIELYEDSEQAYDEAGCAEEYEAFIRCALDNAECDTDDGELTGIYDVCDPELQTAASCITPQQ